MAGSAPIATVPIDACVLCLESLAGESPHDHAEGVSGTTALPCNHTNHTACLKRWERRQRTCPVCRAEFDRFLNPEQDAADETGDTAVEVEDRFLEAAYRGHDAVVARLIAAGANVHMWDDYALRVAAHQGRDAVVARLLAAGADVHAGDDDALRAAASRGHDAVTARLLVAGANVHVRDDEALLAAAREGHAAVVGRLIAFGANVHAQDDAALRLATGRGDDAVVALLRAAQ